VERLCEALVRAQRDQAAPLGVGLHNVVVTDPVSKAPPRILPCPALTLSAPNDLFGLDASVLAAIAPETVRGIPLNSRAHDRYALGTLAAIAIGCRPSRLTADDDERVEAQARGALLTASDARSAVEPFLRGTAQVRSLFDTVGRYRHPVPDARPIGVGELRSALAAVTDLIGLATALRPADPEAAVRVLSWADGRDVGRAVECRRLAAGICAEQGDLSGALAHLDQAVASAPHHVAARQQRGETLWRLLMATPEEAGPGRAVDLAADMEFVISRVAEGFPALLSMAADAYRRLGRYEAEVQAREKAKDSDPADVGLLLGYGRCLRRLNQREKVIEVVRQATRRIRTMTAAGMFSERGGREWQAAFDALLE
jgi:tetratricopeptide (TPR) repeat protein